MLYKLKIFNFFGELTLLLFSRLSDNVDLFWFDSQRRVDGDVLAAAVRAVDDDVVLLRDKIGLICSTVSFTDLDCC